MPKLPNVKDQITGVAAMDLQQKDVGTPIHRVNVLTSGSEESK